MRQVLLTVALVLVAAVFIVLVAPNYELPATTSRAMQAAKFIVACMLMSVFQLAWDVLQSRLRKTPLIKTNACCTKAPFVVTRC